MFLGLLPKIALPRIALFTADGSRTAMPESPLPVIVLSSMSLPLLPDPVSRRIPERPLFWIWLAKKLFPTPAADIADATRAPAVRLFALAASREEMPHSTKPE